MDILRFRRILREIYLLYLFINAWMNNIYLLMSITERIKTRINILKNNISTRINYKK